MLVARHTQAVDLPVTYAQEVVGISADGAAYVVRRIYIDNLDILDGDKSCRYPKASGIRPIGVSLYQCGSPSGCKEYPVYDRADLVACTTEAEASRRLQTAKTIFAKVGIELWPKLNKLSEKKGTKPGTTMYPLPEASTKRLGIEGAVLVHAVEMIAPEEEGLPPAGVRGVLSVAAKGFGKVELLRHELLTHSYAAILLEAPVYHAESQTLFVSWHDANAEGPHFFKNLKLSDIAAKLSASER
jgi:hypothetical protein